MIAGEFDGKKGPAKTFTPINVWDLRARSGQDGDAHDARRPHDRGHADARPRAHQWRATRPAESQLAKLAREGGEFTITAEGDLAALVLAASRSTSRWSATALSS